MAYCRELYLNIISPDHPFRSVKKSVIFQQVKLASCFWQIRWKKRSSKSLTRHLKFIIFMSRSHFTELQLALTPLTLYHVHGVSRDLQTPCFACQNDLECANSYIGSSITSTNSPPPPPSPVQDQQEHSAVNRQLLSKIGS